MKAKLFGDHFCSSNNIDSELEVEIELTNSRCLLNINRLDLIPKIKFVEDFLKGDLRKNTIEDYKKSIDAFSDGKFKEPGNNEKNSFQSYLDVFKSLILDIKTNGFSSEISVIPIGDGDVILDGAHRLAIAIVLDCEVAVVRFIGLTKNYNANYFIDRGVDRLTIESWIQDYLSRVDNHATFILWPKLTKAQRKIALETISKSSSVIYQRTDSYTANALHQITAIAYDGHPWTGTSSNRFSGCLRKSKEISGASNQVTTITVEMGNDLAEKTKLSIREYLNVGNAGIHSSDNHKESEYLALHLYNHHFRNVLKNGKAFRYPSFLKKLFTYKKLIQDNGLNVDRFVIVSSSVLGLYGLRNPNDIDFLSDEDKFDVIENEFIENHHHVLDCYNLKLRDYLYEPRNYIYFFGVKIYCIDEMIASNRNRKENTKYTDIQLASLCLKRKMSHIYWLRVLGFFQRTVRSIRLTIVDFFVYLSKWFPIIKTVYRKYIK
ncbi:hypothetical protein AB6D86_06965 [Vibrio splendidus]